MTNHSTDEVSDMSRTRGAGYMGGRKGEFPVSRALAQEKATLATDIIGCLVNQTLRVLKLSYV